MNDSEKITNLKVLLAPALAWHKKALAEEGEDYVYDRAYEHFDDMRRGDLEQILNILNS